MPTHSPDRDPAPAVPLPAQLTLRAPAAMRYADLLAALRDAHARGVRRAYVLVEPGGAPAAVQ